MKLRKADSPSPLSSKWSVLANYNAERARGIVHTDEWVERMKREQRLFDEEQRYEMGVSAEVPPATPPPPPVRLSR